MVKKNKTGNKAKGADVESDLAEEVLEADKREDAGGMVEVTDTLESKAKGEKTERKESREPRELKEKIKTVFTENRVLTEDSADAAELYNQSRYGQVLSGNKVELALIEALYLLDKGKIEILSGRNKNYSFDEFLKKAQKTEANFWIKFCVYKDIRNRGYIIKTALKFGADFRIYDRGVKPGEDHAKWVVFPVHEGSTFTWHEWAAKNRVAHSTKKRLLIAVVDNEGDVSYWEARWVRP